MIPTSLGHSSANRLWSACAAVLQRIRKNIAKYKRRLVRCFSPPIVYLAAPCLKWCVCLAASGVSMQCLGGDILPSHPLGAAAPTAASLPQHLRSIQHDPAGLCCALHSPHHCPRKPQSCPQSILPHAQFAVLFTGSFALQPAPFSSLCRTGFNTPPCKTLN